MIGKRPSDKVLAGKAFGPLKGIKNFDKDVTPAGHRVTLHDRVVGEAFLCHVVKPRDLIEDCFKDTASLQGCPSQFDMLNSKIYPVPCFATVLFSRQLGNSTFAIGIDVLLKSYFFNPPFNVVVRTKIIFVLFEVEVIDLLDPLNHMLKG